MLATELHTRDIPRVYARFAEEINERHWKERVRALKSEIRGNKFLRELHQQENAIAFQLERLGSLYARFGATGVFPYNDSGIFPAASFAAQVLSVIDASDNVLADRFRGRVRGAFKNPDDMRGLRLELTTATHFLRAGKKVIWPEMISSPKHQQGHSFDLLIENIGSKGLEIECKSFSEEKGRRIRRHQVLNFYNQVVRSKHWKNIDKHLSDNIVVVVTVPDILPIDYRARQALADDVAEAIAIPSATPRDVELKDATLHITVVDATQLSMFNTPTPSRAELRQLFNKITNTRNKEIVLIKTKAGGTFILAVQSSKDDELMDAMIKTLKNAASRQLSGNRAGLVVVGLDGLAPTELINVAMHENRQNVSPTVLQLVANRLLSSSDRDHVIGLAFFSTDQFRSIASDIQGSGGSTYFFLKRESTYWEEAFNGIFSEPA
jgi:hypothetical protein